MIHRILAILFLAGTTVTLAAQSNISFELNADKYNTGGGAVVAGDFDNDGKPDIVQCCDTSGLVFRAGNGDGTFQAPVAAVAASNVVSLVTADFNGDGKLDLAGLDDRNLQLDVWYGKGDGTFQSPQAYSLTNPPGSVAMGNFFSDGHWDIAVGEQNGNIDLFRNEGSGFTFAKSINLGNSGGSQVQLDAGDLNGNGVSDIAVAMAFGASPSAASVLWNDGKGNFTQQELGSYTEPLVRMSRLNGDGMQDVIVGYTCDPHVVNPGPGKGPQYNACAGFDVFYGQGNNSLYKRTVIADPGVFGPGIAEGLAVWGADVNGDGYGDIVAATATGCWCSFGLFVWQGNADGSFQQTPQQFIVSTDSAGPIAAADFNRDGMLDFAMDLGSAGQAELYINSTSRAACGTYAISPSVTSCQPVDNTYSPSPVRVQATSYDTLQVTAMQEYVDYKLVYSQPVTGFNTTFSEAPGTHLFVTQGWDASGRSFVADRTVTVYSGTPGPACPAAPQSANICLPSGTSSGSPVHILANGYSPEWVPTAAQLYINGNLVVNNEGNCFQNGFCAGGTSYVDTYQNLATGTYTITFKLWNANGDAYTARKTITVD